MLAIHEAKTQEDLLAAAPDFEEQMEAALASQMGKILDVCDTEDERAAVEDYYAG